MNEKDKQRVIQRYEKRLDEFGATIDALASGNDERRRLRFDVLRQVGLTDGDSVLDLGCGFGDFSSYLEGVGLDVGYTGIDINPSLIEEARSMHPGKDFRVSDIQSEDPGKFDYVVSTSSFNLKLKAEDNYEFVDSLLQCCYRASRKGVAIDFLSSYVDFRGNPSEAFYYDPGRIFDIAKGVTKRVCLRHDYPLFEFCLYLYPDFEGWANN